MKKSGNRKLEIFSMDVFQKKSLYTLTPKIYTLHTYMHIYACIHTFHRYTQIYSYMYTCRETHTYMHLCIHMHAYTREQTRAHTLNLNDDR